MSRNTEKENAGKTMKPTVEPVTSVRMAPDGLPLNSLHPMFNSGNTHIDICNWNAFILTGALPAYS